MSKGKLEREENIRSQCSMREARLKATALLEVSSASYNDFCRYFSRRAELAMQI
jgi:hypothetical protein